jgi:membrane protein DedA with SNARE-associated domain
MNFSADQIMQWLQIYGYFILFPLVVVEGPIVTVIAGLAVSLGYLNFFIAYLVVVAGDLGGDIIYYVIGRFGREGFLKKWGKYIGLKAEHVIHVEKHFEKHGNKTLFIGKMAYGIGALFLVAAGLAKMAFSKFIFANMTATLLKSLLLVLVGFYFGQAITKINSVFEFLGAISIVIFIAVVLAYFYYYPKKEKREPYE